MKTKGKGSIKSNTKELGGKVECKEGCQSECVGVVAKLDGDPY